MSKEIAKFALKMELDLLPWDPQSPPHIERLFDQRVQCGWNSNLVAESWKNAQQAGTKCIYWIAFNTNGVDTHRLLLKHKLAYPKEAGPIQDTAASVRGVARNPSLINFCPIGHIALDSSKYGVEQLFLDLPDSGVYWITTFYVSLALRSLGIGRSAMDKIEAMAITPPLSATTLALDTIWKEDQVDSAIVKAYYAENSPKVVNQTWYERRGYVALKVVQNYYRDVGKDGKIHDMRTVFMAKRLDH